TLHEVGDSELNFGETHSLGMAQYRHHQAFAAANRYADVEIIAIDDVATAYFSIHLRNELERIDGGFDKKSHEAELDLILFLKTCPVLFAQRYHRRHIDLVEGGEERCRLLGFHEPLRDTPTHRAHRHGFFLPFRGWLRCRCRRFDRR